MKDEELIGKQFALLTVKKVYRDSKRIRRCDCLCECGNEKKGIYYSNLVAKRTKSCGHLEKENREKYVDMKEMVFGELQVVGRTNRRCEGTVIWKCKCSCGSYVYASRRQLIRGYSTECTNHWINTSRGRTINELTIKSYNQSTHKVLCICSCGKEVQVQRSNLLNGHTKSCGHLNKNSYFTPIDGTIPELLRMKIPKNNKSGIKGVSQLKNGMWQANITLRRKRYRLGNFLSLEEAADARLKAENTLFKPILDALEKNNELRKKASS